MSHARRNSLCEQRDVSRQPSHNNFMAGRRQQTAADFRPPKPQHKSSSADASSIGRYVATHSGALDTSRPEHERNNTAPMRLRRTGTATTSRTLQLYDATNRAEKNHDQAIEVDNGYLALNPWYNQHKDKPVFGLASPLPRTVRRGMWWGRADLRNSLYNIDEAEDNKIERHDGSSLEKARREAGNHSSHPIRSGLDPCCIPDLEDDNPVAFNTPFDPDRPPQTRHGTDYFTSSARNQTLDDVARDRAPVNEHGLTTSNHNEAPSRNHFGLADGLPPLQELDKHETSGTEREKAEVQRREHEAQQEFYNQYRNPIARYRAKYPQAPAEFLATFVYLFLGLCVNLSVATSREATGSFETQAWGWGFAIMVGIYLGGGVSGAHLSPTISISLTVYRGFPWRMAFVYICMQMLAGLCAGALAFALYRDAIHAIDPDMTVEITGKALFPKGPSFSTAGGFFNDFVYMAIYVCITFALGDDQNSPPGQGMTALIFGFTGFVTMVALGYNTGLGISPARDLGPRLIGLWAGYNDAFTGGYWAYGPFGASVGGALFGGLIYDLFIFVGGESPVNYRWPQLGELTRRVKEEKQQVKDKIQRVV